MYWDDGLSRESVLIADPKESRWDTAHQPTWHHPTAWLPHPAATESRSAPSESLQDATRQDHPTYACMTVERMDD